jgi:hypothetical protein
VPATPTALLSPPHAAPLVGTPSSTPTLLITATPQPPSYTTQRGAPGFIIIPDTPTPTPVRTVITPQRSPLPRR